VPLLFPVLAQVLLTLVLLFAMGFMRIGAIRSGLVRFRDVKLSGDAYPESERKVSNSVRNQFETPVLFYALCGVAIYVGATGFVMTLLAWLYVFTRLIHALIHVTHNRVPQRFVPFLIGLIVLVLMWIVIVARLLMAG
jgi:hypothetical protein